MYDFLRLTPILISLQHSLPSRNETWPPHRIDPGESLPPAELARITGRAAASGFTLARLQSPASPCQFAAHSAR